MIGHCGKLKPLSTSVVFFQFSIVGSLVGIQERSKIKSQHDKQSNHVCHQTLTYNQTPLRCKA